MAGTGARTQVGLGASGPGGGRAPLPGRPRIKGETGPYSSDIRGVCLSLFVLLTGQALLPLGPGTRPTPRRRVTLHAAVSCVAQMWLPMEQAPQKRSAARTRRACCFLHFKRLQGRKTLRLGAYENQNGMVRKGTSHVNVIRNNQFLIALLEEILFTINIYMYDVSVLFNHWNTYGFT